MKTDRREFLKTALAGGALACAAGCMSGKGFSSGKEGSLVGFKAPPMDRIRLGFIGLGERGMAGFHRALLFPGPEAAAICDIRPEAVDDAAAFLKKWNVPGAAHQYKGKADSWKGVCEDPEVDVVYIATPAGLHADMEVYALEHGKHVLCEVPGAMKIEDCWRIVNAAEKAQRHCYLLENRCFREAECLALSLAKQGILGELSHAEAAYIHPLCWRHLEDSFRNRRLKESLRRDSNWNTYPTHPLGPMCKYLDINCGDRMTTLVSMSNDDFTHRAYARANFPADAWQNKVQYNGCDINTTLIRTAKGRTIELKFNISTPRPYTRINLLAGTKGCFQGEPFELVAFDKDGGPYGFDNEPQWFDEKKRAEYAETYMHPLWKKFGPAFKELGAIKKCSDFFAGHGGVDYILELSWVYSFRTGSPMPQNVYDLATWSSIVELTRDSVRGGSCPVEVPDFTRGGWARNEVPPLVDFNASDIGVDLERIKATAKRWAGV